MKTNAYSVNTSIVSFHALRHLVCLLFLGVFAMWSTTASAQKGKKQTLDPKIIKKVESMPEFPGGYQGLYQYLVKEVNYPADAKAKKISGKVVVSFFVETNGKITNVKVMHSAYPSLDAEAVRAVKSMPNWKPAILNGKPVRLRMVIPVSFKL